MIWRSTTQMGRASSLLSFGVLLALAGVLIWSGEGLEYRWVNPDVANALYVGRRVLLGELLYVDWYYFVMPPVVLLSQAACLLADLVGLHPQTTVHLSVVAVAALGVAVIRRAEPQIALSGFLSLLTYLGIAVHTGVNPFNFAQREHFFALLLTPYFLWRLSGRGPSPAVYLLAGLLGFCCMVKPHFIVAVCVIELFFLREPAFRKRLWLLFSLGGVAPFAILALEPDSLRALFSRAVSYQLSQDYDAYSIPLTPFLSSPKGILLTVPLVAVIAVGIWARTRSAVTNRHALLAMMLTGVLYAAYLQQQKYFGYHALPYVAVAAVWSVATVAQIARTTPWRVARQAARALIVFPVLLIGLGLGLLIQMSVDAPWQHHVPVLAALEGKRSVMLITPSIEGPIFSYALDHGLEVVGPWTSNYTVPPLLDITDREQRESALRHYFEPLGRRLAEVHPELVIFSPSRQSLGGLNMHELFVEQLGVFPSTDYSEAEVLDYNWIVYSRTSMRQ